MKVYLLVWYRHHGDTLFEAVCSSRAVAEKAKARALAKDETKDAEDYDIVEHEVED